MNKRRDQHTPSDIFAVYLIRHFCAVITLTLIFPLLGTNAFAEPKLKQHLFNIKLDIQPNSMFAVKQVTGDIPISLYTDEKGDAAALHVGSDKQIIMVENNANQKFSMPAGSAVIDHDLSSKKKYTLMASSPVRADQELFYVDATGVDKERGGKVILRYPSSIILGSTNQTEIYLRRFADRWVATIEESSFLGFDKQEKIIAEAKIVNSFTGLGLNEPEFQFLDPNDVVKKLTVSKVSDPAMIQAHSTAIKSALQGLEKNKIAIPEYGLSVQMQSAQ